MNLEKLLGLINVPKNIVDAFSADKMPDNADELVEEFMSSQKTDTINYFKASKDYQDAIDLARNGTFSKSTIKYMKELKNEFGMEMSNQDLEKTNFSDFMVKLKSHIEADNGHKGDDKLATEVGRLKKDMIAIMKEKDALNDRIEALQVEKETAVKEATDQLKAETLWADLIAKDSELGTLNIPGKSFALDAIKKTVFESYKISPDGKLTDKEGNAVKHPKKDRVVTEVKELFDFYKEEAGLVKRSNAGTGTIQQGAEGAEGEFKISSSAIDKLKAIQSQRSEVLI